MKSLARRRRTFIRWTDDGDPVPVLIEDGTPPRVLVDDAGLLDMVRQTIATLPQYVSDEDTLGTLAGMIDTPRDPGTSRRDMFPIVGVLIECDKEGNEL